MSTTEVPELFHWSNGLIVIFAERDDSNWAISRGWRRGDRLEDVRRWQFESERRFIGQLRRLVREATEDHHAANSAAADLERWISSLKSDSE